MSVVADTEAAIAAATHLSDMDKGAVAALRVLAAKVDAMADQAAGVSEDGELHEEKRRPIDNVTLPTYLKYCESLGLTPAGRRTLKDGKAGGSAPTSLAERRARHVRPA
jgi:hypothetical protein